MMNETKELENAEVVVADLDTEQTRNEQVRDISQPENHIAQNDQDFSPLFEDRVAEQLRSHWLEIQTRFVDDPNQSLKDADDLIIHMIENVISTLSEKRMTIEGQWQRDDQVSTEDLRLALKYYRSFFNSLLFLDY
jgi:hypothetical protein